MSKEKSKEYIVLQGIIGTKSVAFHPDFARALGSVTAGLFMSQGFFWQFNAKHVETVTIDGEEYFSRTISEWEEETALSEEQQKGARALLMKCGILKEKKAGLPARLYYHFDFDALVAVIYRYKETKEQVAVDNRSKKRYLPRTSSGKIRRQVAVNHGDNYNEREFKRVSETTTEREKVAEAAERTGEILPFEEEKKDTPPIPAAPPKSEPVPENPYTAPRPATAAAPDALVQLEWLETLETDYRIPELLQAAHGVPKEKHLDYLAAFRARITMIEKVHPTYQKLKEHYLNFCNTRWIDEQKTKANETAPGPARKSIHNHFGGDASKYTEASAHW